MRIVLSKAPLILFLVLLWIGFLAFSISDELGLFGWTDIGKEETFMTSKSARSMVIDVILLSLLAAGWIVWDGYTSHVGKTISLPFALLTLFIGSSGLLLYLIIRVALWKDNKWVIAERNLSESWGPFKIKKYK